MGVLNPKLRGFYETRGIRNYVLYGGRGSSKTYHTAGHCVRLARTCKAKFLCVRQFQNRISDSVKTVIEECIYTLGCEDEFSITENSITHLDTGSTFAFFGIQRNLKEIKGIAGVDILWIEEAEDLTKEQWEILEPTVRANRSMIFIVFNPRYVSDFVYKRFVTNPPDKTLVRKINYDENPYLSQTMKDIISYAKANDPEGYDHIYGGNPLQDDDNVIIKRSWVMASIDAHKALGLELTGRKRIGFDIADDGDDKCANVYAHGSFVEWADMWKGAEDELLKSCTRTYKAAQERKASIIYDSIGVGASAGAKFGELNTTNYGNTVQYSKFNAGGAVWRPDSIYSGTVKNKDQFINIKAQAWWMLADRFRNTYNAVKNGHKFKDDELISISSSMPYLTQLIDELTTPKREFDNNGRVKVESKKDLVKRGIPSPNLADALVLAFAPGNEPMVISNDAMAQLMHTRSR